MIDLKEKQISLLAENFNPICNRINEFQKRGQAFILRDLLDDSDKTNSYYIYLTKGILLSLIHNGDISIIGTYNGYKNFLYMPKNKIKLPSITQE